MYKRQKGLEEKQKIFFEAGQYVISSFNELFLESLTHLKREVLNKIDLSSDYKLYIKGSATKLPYKGDFIEEYEYRKVKIHPLGYSKESFLSTTKTEFISAPISNKNLPNLRAEFIRQKIKTSFDINSEILEGVPTERINDSDRNVSIFLYTNWE